MARAMQITDGMRWLVLAAACGCAGNAPGAMPPGPGPVEESGGGLPTPYCGEGFCNQCVGCGQRDSLCFGENWWFQLGVGQCVSSPEPGEVSLGAFTATESAGVVADVYVEIVARSANQAIAVMAPATLGAQPCSVFSEYAGSAVSTPACAITLTVVGAVGERIEGTLTVGADTGSFSVTRVAYP